MNGQRRTAKEIILDFPISDEVPASLREILDELKAAEDAQPATETHTEYAVRTADGSVRYWWTQDSFEDAMESIDSLHRHSPPSYRNDGIHGPWSVVSREVTTTEWTEVTR